MPIIGWNTHKDQTGGGPSHGLSGIATPHAAEGIDRLQDFVASGHVTVADGDSFARQLSDALTRRHKASKFAANSFCYDCYLAEFLRFCGSGLPRDPRQ